MNLKVVAIAGSAASLVAGAVGGYFFAKKQLETKYADLATQEIEEASEFYKTLYKKGEDETPEGALAKRIPEATLTPAQKADTRTHVIPPVPVLERVLTGLKYGDIAKTNGSVVPDDDQDDEWLENVADSSGPQPYIISIAEYHEGDKIFNNVPLTYYAEDDLLLDAQEMPIDNVDELIGENTLESFGRKSRDPNVVYVRNIRISTDFEVTKNPGSYAALVHGVRENRRSKVGRMPREL